jgi:hypothetical protein
MDLAAIIRSAVQTAESVAGGVRVLAVHYPVTGRDAFGPTYGDPVNREAFMEFHAEGVTLSDGTETTSRAKLTFFEPVAIGDRDQFVVPDGSGGTIRINVQAVKGPIDLATNIPYFAEVLLGTKGNR